MRYSKLSLALLALCLIGGCRTPNEETGHNIGPQIGTKVRLCICTPDGHYYNMASAPDRLGSTRARSHDILLSESQMARVIHLVRKKHKLSWRDMTAESPYPKTYTVLLWYGSEPSGADSQMCTLGTSETASPILQELVLCLPESLRQDFRKSLEGMKSTQQGTEGDAVNRAP